MSEPGAPSHIVILGLMGVGKTTTARALSDALGWPYSDSDTEIEQLTGVPGRVVAEQLGIPALHLIEAALLLGALARPKPHVITAAASVVENKTVTDELVQKSFVVRLRAPVETTLARQSDGDHRRPMTKTELEELMVRREPLFASVEDLTLDAGRSTRELVRGIIDAHK